MTKIEEQTIKKVRQNILGRRIKYSNVPSGHDQTLEDLCDLLDAEIPKLGHHTTRIKAGDRVKIPKKSPAQGWECPKCGSVYAIWVSECKTCKNSNIKIVSSNTASGYNLG